MIHLCRRQLGATISRAFSPLFHARFLPPRHPARTQCNGFDLGSPGLFLTQSDEKRPVGNASGHNFAQSDEKMPPGGLPGNASGDALSKQRPQIITHAA